MAIDNNFLRTTIWKTIYNGLTAANITASDIQNSSVPISITSSYTNQRNNLPELVIGKVKAIPNKIYFDDAGADMPSEKEIRVPIDIYTSNNEQLDQFTDQVVRYFETNKINGLPLVGYDNDDEFNNLNTNRIMHKFLGFTFRRGA